MQMHTSGDTENTHDSHDGRINWNEIRFHLFENDADDGQDDDADIQLVPLVFDVAAHAQRHHFARRFDDEHGREEIVKDAQCVLQFLV